MITRIWHGRTHKSKARDYLNFLLQNGTRGYRETEGNLSVKVWTKEESEVTHFWTVTEWPTIDSIKKFAGQDYEKAKYYPEDDGVLLEFEDKVEHYQCHDVSHQRIREYVRQLNQLYTGGSWQGESIAEKLKNITEAEAFQQPLSDVHSVAEIVWHCIYWRKVFLKRVAGDQLYRDQTVQALNFLPLAELREKGWHALRAELDQTQSDILGVLHTQRDSFLEAQYQPGYTFDYLVEGLIQHDIYHLGQIGLVIRMNRATRNSASPS